MMRFTSFPTSIGLPAILAAGWMICAVGCSCSSESSPPQVIGEPAPGEFKDLKLQINGRDALEETLVVAPREKLKVAGSFRFATPVVKGRTSVHNVALEFTMPYKGGEVTALGAGAQFKLLDDRRAKFSCEMTAPSDQREYTLKITGMGTLDDKIRIVMETKVRVKK